MTYIGHMKTIKIAEFKSHLSKTLQSVRAGERIIILDRQTPIAEVSPINRTEQLVVSLPSIPLRIPRRTLRVRRARPAE